MFVKQHMCLRDDALETDCVSVMLFFPFPIVSAQRRSIVSKLPNPRTHTLRSSYRSNHLKLKPRSKRESLRSRISSVPWGTSGAVSYASNAPTIRLAPAPNPHPSLPAIMILVPALYSVALTSTGLPLPSFPHGSTAASFTPTTALTTSAASGMPSRLTDFKRARSASARENQTPCVSNLPLRQRGNICYQRP